MAWALQSRSTLIAKTPIPRKNTAAADRGQVRERDRVAAYRLTKIGVQSKGVAGVHLGRIVAKCLFVIV